jgi:hypothetical protein
VNGVCSLVQRVAGTSLEEIDNMIVELQKVRVFLVREGERLQRELADYGKLTRATLRSSRIVTDSLPSCKLIAQDTGAGPTMPRRQRSPPPTIAWDCRAFPGAQRAGFAAFRDSEPAPRTNKMG